MPNNQDKTETTPKAATSTPTQDNKPSVGMDATENKPAAPTNAPGRMDFNKGKQPDAARTPDVNKQADSDRDKKFGKSHDAPNKGI